MATPSPFAGFPHSSVAFELRVAAAVKAAEEAVAFVAQALEQAETDDMIAEELGDDPESEKARAAARKAREVAATVQAEIDRHHANVLRMKHAA